METKIVRQESSSVYLLQHVAREGSNDEDVKVLGIYSTEKKARLAISRFKKLAGFKRYPNGFYVGRYKLDRAEWSEGFFTRRTEPRNSRKRKGVASTLVATNS